MSKDFWRDAYKGVSSNLMGGCQHSRADTWKAPSASIRGIHGFLNNAILPAQHSSWWETTLEGQKESRDLMNTNANCWDWFLLLLLFCKDLCLLMEISRKILLFPTLHRYGVSQHKHYSISFTYTFLGACFSLFLVLLCILAVMMKSVWWNVSESKTFNQRAEKSSNCGLMPKL